MELDHCHRASCVQIIDQLRTTITEKDARITDLEQALDELGVTPDEAKRGAERSRAKSARIAQFEEALRLALANLNWCEQAIADLLPQPYPLTLKDARDAINKINEVLAP